MKRSNDRPVIDVDEQKLKKIIAKGILESRVPVSGRELKLIRSAIGISMHELARKLGVTATAVYHWEKASKRRLSIINEIAVKILCAEVTARFECAWSEKPPLNGSIARPKAS